MPRRTQYNVGRKPDFSHYRDLTTTKETTYKADYIRHQHEGPAPFPLPESEIFMLHEQPRKVPEPEKVLKRHPYTFTHFKHVDAHIPFDFFYKPNAISKTHPKDVPPPYEKEVMERADAEVRKTRPRVGMLPAISIDDIQDEERRKAVLKVTYSTTTGTAAEDVVVAGGINENKITAPLPGSLYGRRIPEIHFNKRVTKYVNPEWCVGQNEKLSGTSNFIYRRR